MALLDIVMVQTDRNSGNFMLGPPDDTGAPTLIPIDHGLVLPPRKGLALRAQRGMTKGNMVLEMPGANEKFDDELQGSIEMLDPDEIEQNLLRQRQALAQQHPQLPVDPLVNDDSILMAKRSAQFLKFAAKELTIREIYQTLAAENVTLLTCSDQEMPRVFADAVANAKLRGVAVREVESYTKTQRADMRKTLMGLGWCQQEGFTAFDEWLETFAANDALRWYKMRVENPAVRQELDQSLKALGHPDALLQELKGRTLIDKVKRVREAIEKLDPAGPRAGEVDQLAGQLQITGKDLTPATRQLLADALDAFPKNTAKQLNVNLQADIKSKRIQIANRIVNATPNAGPLVEQLRNEYPMFPHTDANIVQINLKHLADMRRVEQQTGVTYQQLLDMEEAGERIFSNAKAFPDAIGLLLQWKRYQDLGGDEALGNVGVDVADMPKFSSQLDSLLGLESQKLGSQLVTRQLANATATEDVVGGTASDDVAQNLVQAFSEPVQDSGITASMKKDLNRAQFVLNGVELTSAGVDDENVRMALDELNKAMPAGMLAAVSQIANQGMLLEMERLLQTGKGPIPEVPVTVSESESSSYEIDVLPEGDVLITGRMVRNFFKLIDPKSGNSRDVSPQSVFRFHYQVTLRQTEVMVGKPVPHVGPIAFYVNVVPA